MSWYRTYRPTTISGLHLKRVVEQLQAVLASGRLPQVMLFAGPKGTGKTSTARIIAALANTEANQAAVTASFTGVNTPASGLVEPDYTQDLVRRIKAGQALNVIELDAASHRGIDDVRALKEQALLPPAEGWVKVIILDEVHMLTTEAFNALLKILEEPPAQTMFILATTELHKILPTVVSRCFVVEFSRATVAELVVPLQQITKQEAITTDQAALELIAESADGSFRDAVKVAEQLSQELGSLTAAGVQQRLLGSLSSEVADLVTAIVAKQAQTVATIFAAWRDRQMSAAVVEKQVLSWLHRNVRQALGVEPGTPQITDRVAVFLLAQLTPACGQTLSPLPLLPLEVACLDLVFRAKDKDKKPASPPPASSSSKSSPQLAHSPQSTPTISAAPPVKTVAAEIEPAEGASPESDLEPEPEPEPAIFETPDANLRPIDPAESTRLLEKWQQVIEGVKARNTSLAAILGSARPKVGDQGQAQICVFYKFHQEQLQQPRFKKMIDESLTEVVGTLVPVEFVLEHIPAAASGEDVAGSGAVSPALVADILV